MRYLYRWRLLLSSLCLASAGLPTQAQVEALTGLDFGRLVPREVRVFLPPDGVTPETPLLVALDGQNMEQWRLAETVATLAAAHRITPPLVVGITAGPHRLDEYGLAKMPDYAGRGARAEEFERFVLSQVLPAVRAKYHLPADRSRTGVMGASLGGLSAFDLGWRHPDVFGFAGIFSGSFWWRGENTPESAKVTSRLAHRLVRETAPDALPRHLRLWFENGTADETDDRDHNGVIDAIQDTQELIDALAARGLPRGPDLAYVEIPGGRHHESTWAQALPEFLSWALPYAPPPPVDARARELINRLHLQYLPGESGYYGIIGRSAQRVASDGRPLAAQSQIHYLLTAELPVNYLHWLASDDTHILLEGGPVDYFIFHTDGHAERVTLGRDLAAGQRLVVAVPGNCWKALRLHPGATFALMANVLSPEWTPDRVRIGAGEEFVARYLHAAPWATETELRALIGPNFRPAGK